MEEWRTLADLLLAVAEQFNCTLVVETAHLEFARHHADQTIYLDAQGSAVFSCEQAFALTNRHTSWVAYLRRLGTYTHSHAAI